MILRLAGSYLACSCRLLPGKQHDGKVAKNGHDDINGQGDNDLDRNQLPFAKKLHR